MPVSYYKNEDVKECSQLLISAYNCPPWNDGWTLETAQRYLNEFSDCKRFVGFVLRENEKIIGAAFCHEKIWWTADELFIDEFYILPDYQRKGCGSILLSKIEEYAKEKALAGLTLLTNKYTPAPNFYLKNGFVNAEHVIYMYKEF